MTHGRDHQIYILNTPPIPLSPEVRTVIPSHLIVRIRPSPSYTKS